MIAAMASTQGLWFLSRGSGLVLLVLFSVIVALGVAVASGYGRPPVAQVLDRRGAPDAVAVRDRAAGAAYHHRAARSVRHDRLGGDAGAVRLALPDSSGRGGHPGASIWPVPCW